MVFDVRLKFRFFVGLEREEDRDENTGNNPEKNIQRCTDFHKVTKSVIARVIDHGIGLIAHGCHKTQTRSKGHRH